MSEPVSKTRRYPVPDPTVVYVAGSGRSGSTMLERMLGAVPGYVNIGELLDLPRKVAPHDELCGCGQPFSACPFWSAVGTRLEQGWSPAWLEQTHLLQTRVARQRHLPRLLAPGTGAFAADLAEYARRYRMIVSAVAEEAGADYVVDASKWPSLAMALFRGGVDVRVIHLVRDVRGVTASLAKTVERPHTSGRTEQMYSNSLPDGAARWLATQTEVDLLAVAGLKVVRMRYAELVTEPERTITEALTRLGAAVPAGGFEHLGHTIEGVPQVRLAPSHGLSGNPSRFRSGAVELRRDEEWQARLTSGQQRLVRAIAFPQVLRDRPTTVQRRDAATPGPVTTTGAAPDAAVPEVTSWPSVLVLMATRGRPELAAEMLQSVVEQDYPGPIDCLVVHDQEEANPDLAALSRPDRTIVVVTNAGTPGLAGARNYGLTQARADFVATTDDDDRWHRSKIRRQVERFRAEPDLLLLGTGIRLLLPKGRVDAWVGRADRVPRETLLGNRVKELHSSTLMMPWRTVELTGGYDEQIPQGYGEDYDFVLRVASLGPVGVIREPLADIRKDNVSYYRGKADTAAKAFEYLLAKHPEIEASPAGHARMLGQIAFARSASGHPDGAWRLAAAGIRRKPTSPYPYIALTHLVTRVEPQRIADLARLFGRGLG